jgi:transposase
MARYKSDDLKQITLVPVSFQDQIFPGSFEYALNEIVDQHIDMTRFESRYNNDETGCLAYDPAILLKIVLFGYYTGIISSRRLAEACQRNVQFNALTADAQPHFTTIADFVSTLDKEIAGVFRDVLVNADALGLMANKPLPSTGASCRRMLPKSGAAPTKNFCTNSRNTQRPPKRSSLVTVARRQGKTQPNGPTGRQEISHLQTQDG